MTITLTSAILKNIPKTPGIYQYFDKNGKIIYIGKSIHLFSRVHSYFNGKSKLNFAKQKMVDQICDIQYIITNNERESLILETTLIKQHLPKYNILMKDGKSHIYIKITSESIPRIITTRTKGKTGEYFGPYISTGYVKSILKTVKKIFGYRSCNLQFIEEPQTRSLTIKNVNIKIPCLDYYIKRCSGPCLLKENKIKEYIESITFIRNFLKGNFAEVKKELTEKMYNYAKELNFEKAEELKKELIAMDSLHEHQIVKDFTEKDANIVQYLEKFEKHFVGILKIRDHKMVGFYPYEIENKLEKDKQDIICSVVEQINADGHEIEKQLKYIFPFTLGILSKNIGEYEVPKIGIKHDLLKLCYKNLYEFAYKKHLASLSTKGFTKQNMKNLLHILGYERINKKILFECNDISHLSGTHTVASRSVIENGKTANGLYRKFRIKELSVGKIDDFNSMREIMTRRIKEIIKTGIIPDLIIIDGGKGQLSSVIEIIDGYLEQLLEKKDRENNVELPLVANMIADNIEKEHPQGDVHTKINTHELIKKIQLVGIAKREEELFLPGESESIILSKDSPELKLVQKIRDEAHRFAITFNRDSRIKSMQKNILESLPGFGPVTRKKILKEYGSVESLKNASNSSLQKILTTAQIETLEDHGLLG